MKTKITKALFERVPLSPGPGTSYIDSEMRGFMLVVGVTSKRYYAQTLVAGSASRLYSRAGYMMQLRE